MFERFTDSAREVVVHAQDEARALKHDYVGTEHILLGLLREKEGLAARVLESLGITVEEVRAQVARIVGQGDEVTTGQIPFTLRAKKVLERALRESLALDHDRIGSEHILLGLAREDEGVAVRVLHDFGVAPRDVAAPVLAVRGGRVPPGYVEGFLSGWMAEALDDQVVVDLVGSEQPAISQPRPVALLAAGWLLFGVALAVGLLLGRLIWG